VRILQCTPLLAVPAHVLWRRFTYDAWLPNTYYAKAVGAWPAAGMRYLGAFALEYGVWFWALILGVWAWRTLRTPRRPVAEYAWYLVPAAAVLTLVAHAAYYTLLIGGDHFEYRVYSHLIPFLFISAAWATAKLRMRPRPVLLVLATFCLVSWPIPWTHWAHTHDLTSRRSTFRLAKPMAGHFPPPLSYAVMEWDELQSWLVSHAIGRRHQEHKAFWRTLVRKYPTRAEGSAIRWEEEHPVMEAAAVGVVGWMLPNVAIIDFFGLNDRIIARNPVPHGDQHRMAHDRRPPEGYVECFRPNAWLGKKRDVKVYPRDKPLTDADIVACEAKYSAKSP